MFQKISKSRVRFSNVVNSGHRRTFAKLFLDGGEKGFPTTTLRENQPGRSSL